jgi:hypothetical protein
MKKTLYTLALLALSLGAAAQNLNPTVEVTNTYKREASGIEKPDQLLPLPDSVSRFNYDFDYTVRNTPYRGSYEFKPYNVQLRPNVRPDTQNALYAKLGAGYGFHPEALVVWTPYAGRALQVNVYGSYNAYIGTYRDIQFDATENMFMDSGAKTGGWRDRVATAGADMRLDWDGGAMRADVRYTGTAGADAWAVVNNHGFSADAGVSGSFGRSFRYFLSEHYNYTGNTGLNENHSITNLRIGFPIRSSFLSLALNAQVLNHDGAVTGTAGNFAITPSYGLSIGNLILNAGVKVGFILRDDDTFCPTKAGVIFPDVRATYRLIEDALVLQASVTGGNTINAYETLLSKNHFLGSFAFAPDISTERINVMLGFRGHLRERLHYNVKGGFKSLNNMASWGFSTAGAGYTPLVGYMSPLNTFYVGTEIGWKSDHMDIDANLQYQYSILSKTGLKTNLFGPPAFAASLRAAYRLAGRFVPAVTLDSRTDCPGVDATLPGYADLGFECSFVVNRFWNAWFKVGNLLNQSVQRVPFHAEKGIYFTVGASLNF